MKKLKQNIRRGMFESNSSSSHSISINHSATDFTSMGPYPDNVVELGDGEYGWDFDTFTSPISKADYCAIDNQDNFERLQMLRDVIKEHTGLMVKFNFTGYIDHQSYGTSDEAFKDKETLKKFIFGRGSVLETGNDNV